jgi:hypothetical protein
LGTSYVLGSRWARVERVAEMQSPSIPLSGLGMKALDRSQAYTETRPRVNPHGAGSYTADSRNRAAGPLRVGIERVEQATHPLPRTERRQPLPERGPMLLDTVFHEP